MGVLDKPLRDIADILIKTFSDKKRLFKAEVRSYSPTAGTPATVTVTTAKLWTSPATELTVKSPPDGSKLDYDLTITVAALEVERQGFDIVPSATRLVFVEINGVYCKVIRSKRIESGDQSAAYLVEVKR